MAKDIWLISDTHFCHDNILKFKREDGSPLRDFKDLSHMHEYMVDKWNSVVKPGDKVYHLGDVYMGNTEDFKTLWPRLNGSKRLVVGNHDDVKFLSSGGFFQKVMLWRIFKEFGLILTHVPIHESSFRDANVNVHGHIHDKKSPAGPYKCVCVEQIDYTPVNIEELRVI